MRKDIYESITNKIVAQIEAGTAPWFQPWSNKHHLGPVHRPLRANGQRYSGINVLMLWGAAEEHGYSCPMWMTFKQAVELGGHVRKGSKGQTVVYASKFTKEEKNSAGEDVTRAIPFLKQYTVFNVEQIDGLPDSYYAKPAAPISINQRIENAERFFRNCGATLRHGGDRAFYAPSLDAITMPPFEAFQDAESYYTTLGHEFVHWTRHETRLNRDFGRKRFGDNGYATEELVAEMGSAFLAADLGLSIEPRADHAAYLKSWLEVLKGDSRAIFTAASHASKAVEYLHGLQGQIETREAA